MWLELGVIVAILALNAWFWYQTGRQDERWKLRACIQFAAPAFASLSDPKVQRVEIVVTRDGDRWLATKKIISRRDE